jgi:HTH-type transcriptional regulator/antitoxin HigA
MLRNDGTPIIGLTLRHDRVDNFWFTLFHELMHVLQHLSSGGSGESYFIDDLDVPPDSYPLERDADSLAREALVPKADFEMSAANFVVAPATVGQLAQQLGIADAIVAGRVRYERRNYRLLSSMIGMGKIRHLFPEADYSNESFSEYE